MRIPAASTVNLVLAALAVAAMAAWFVARSGLLSPASIPTVSLSPVSAPGTAGPSAQTPAILLYGHPRALPEIRFADAAGHAMTLADFRGRVALLNLWATWCVPCRKEMPTLDRLEARLGGKDFIVVPLSIDRAGAPAVRKFYRGLGVKNLGIYADPSGRAAFALGALGIPTTLLIDRQGREIARKVGPAVWDSPSMVSLIRRRLRP